MPNEELQEKMVEKVIDLFEELNAEILENVGKSIKKIGKLTPTKAHQLVQQLMYGEDYNKIIRKITKVTGLGKKEIENIFIDAAKKNQKFAKQFYDAKKVSFTPYEKNKILQKEVDAFIKSTEQYYKKITDTGFYIVDGKKVPIKDVYNHMLEKSLMSVSTGQTTYQEEMRRITKEMAAKGIRTRIIEGKDTGTYIVDYASGRTRRLDSVLRMHLLGAMRDMSNKLQEDFGKEFGADGIEISVHINPAIDHENAQGHQFKFKEYSKLNKGLEATDYKGNRITLDHDENGSYRPVSTLNCRHYEWQIVLGVSKPRYSQEQLDEIIRKNKEGFTFEGKHYTNYEGTQLQRQIETKIRNYKDQQIMAKARGDMEDAEKCQKQIKILTRKYNDLHKISGLPTKKDRMVVSGYHPIKVDVPVQAVEKPKLNVVLDNKYDHSSKIFNHSKQYLDLTNNENINIYNGTGKLKITINEKKNIKNCFYKRSFKLLQTTSVRNGEVGPDTTLWHELGHALDNHKGGDLYLSDNLDMRQAVYDYYDANKKVPDRVKEYFAKFRKNAEREFEEQNDYEEYYKNFMDTQKAKGASDFAIKVLESYKQDNMDLYLKSVAREYEWDKRQYYFKKNKTDIIYNQKGNLSDMFSAISKGEYNKDLCSSYGYHTKTYFNQDKTHPYTELFANFVSLKMTNSKEHLDFFKQECPKIYEQLEKLYKEIGDDLLVK